MSIFMWMDEYSVDEGMIDRQHKKLLQIAETLFNAVLAQNDQDYLQNCFDELLDYTKKHFNDEEAYFKTINADELTEHAKEHELLAEELNKVWEKELLGFQDERGRHLLTWVEERLLPHMMIDDQGTYNSKTN